MLIIFFQEKAYTDGKKSHWDRENFENYVLKCIFCCSNVKIPTLLNVSLRTQRDSMRKFQKKFFSL